MPPTFPGTFALAEISVVGLIAGFVLCGQENLDQNQNYEGLPRDLFEPDVSMCFCFHRQDRAETLSLLASGRL